MEFTQVIQEESEKPYFTQLMAYIKERRQEVNVYPKQANLFACFDACNLQEIKVVILGQDPYHQANQAMGYSFSVPKGIKIPPSLMNIYKELENDLGYDIPNHGDLTSWAKQGVLLMNTVMSVEESQPQAHKGKGWEQFSKRVIQTLNDREQPIVFILWGKPAQKNKVLIDDKKHLIIESAHPSPLSSYRGFFGSRPFSKTNAFLKEHNRQEIDWRIEDAI